MLILRYESYNFISQTPDIEKDKGIYLPQEAFVLKKVRQVNTIEISYLSIVEHNYLTHSKDNE